MAALFAISAVVGAAGVADAQTAADPSRVRDYQPVFRQCRDAAGSAGSATRLAIRHMEIDGNGMVLIVDPETLATRLERDQDLACADTDETAQQGTRYIKAVRVVAAPRPGAAGALPDVIANGGLLRGAGEGAFISGDLCPSRRPLDRAFLERLEALQSPLPLALAVSGLWLKRHQADFAWLQAQQRTGALQITWVDHSYSHPYVQGRPIADNFLLMAGVDMRAEILETERLLIANGQTPSVFFRFPGLIANAALMRVVGDYHLIVLGAGAWLARTPRARSGDIILVHPNGNEPAGLEIFATLLAGGKLPRPFRPIDAAP